MLKRLGVVLMAMCCLVVFAGCYTHTHVVGNGPQTGETIQIHQWYALWGLVPITEDKIDTTKYTRGMKDYKIQSQFTPIDCVIDLFTGIVSIGRRTVTITK